MNRALPRHPGLPVGLTCPGARLGPSDGAQSGLTVVSVDHDATTGRTQESDVMVRHSLIQVDQTGTELAKFTGSVSAKASPPRLPDRPSLGDL